MVRQYKRGNGKRQYASFSDSDVDRAITAVGNGMAIRQASRTYNVPRETLRNRLQEKHGSKIGRPTVLSQEEEGVLVRTLAEVAKWGYPMTQDDVKILIKSYLDSVGRQEKRFQSNVPGSDFVRSFMQRNGMSFRTPGNIKRSRARVGKKEIKDYFENLEPVLTDIDPANVYNYDETNVTDDPGAKKVIVPRGMRRVERVQEHSKMAISIMVCGNAAGGLLPPFVVYKALNYYEGWTSNGPRGTKYDATKSGWFDMHTFDRWFFEVFLPYATESPGQKVLVGDNLASHFSPAVVAAAIANNVYFTALPPNSTHMTQPLDVAVFRPMKRIWRNILDSWRKSSRRQGTIPKEIFPSLLSRLWNEMQENVSKNLKSGFRVAGLWPFGPQEVLKNLPDASDEMPNAEEIGRVLDGSLVELLKENRGQNNAPKTKRGKKVKAGALLTVEDCPSAAHQDQDQPGSSATATLPPPEAGQDTSSNDSFDDNVCSVCQAEYTGYDGPEWLQCVFCLHWVCGHCNGAEYDAAYGCPQCSKEN